MRTKNIVAASILIAGTLGMAACGRSGETVTLAGSTAFQPFAEKLAEQFMETHPDVVITVQGGGSSVGIQSAQSGAAQIGMADLVTLPPEAEGLESVVVARDGIAVIVHPSNPVKNLTTEQVRGIFNGTIKNWKELGGPDASITVVSREAGSGTRSSFEKIVNGISLTKDAIVQDSNGTIRETVANDQNAVGYLSHGLLNDKVKAVMIDGKEPSTENIIAGVFPLVRPVFLLTKGPAAGGAKAFIEYILSPEGQTTIKNDGLLPAK
jgi:phosphate transport system substrate-binding protein